MIADPIERMCRADRARVIPATRAKTRPYLKAGIENAEIGYFCRGMRARIMFSGLIFGRVCAVLTRFGLALQGRLGSMFRVSLVEDVWSRWHHSRLA